MLAVVQFIHPGGEPQQKFVGKVGNRIPWHTEKNGGTGHWRKFLLGRGAKYLPQGKRTQLSDITFWGEWEPDSRTVERYGRHPFALHEPMALYENPSKRTNGRDRVPMTTDPLVFGDRFFYTHCRQNSHLRLRDMDPGSLILFGSQHQPEGSDYTFSIDTVFVVQERFQNLTRENAQERFDNEHLIQTNLLGARSKCAYEWSIYTAAMFEDNRDCFSYVPCRLYRAGDEEFQKPNILTDKVLGEFRDLFWPANRQRCKITETSSERIGSLWKAVLEVVYNADLFPGWGMTLSPVQETTEKSQR